MKKVFGAAAAVAVLLFVPWSADSTPPPPPARSPFAWNRDADWKALEEKFQQLRRDGCAGAHTELADAEALLTRLETEPFAPDAPELEQVERALLLSGTTLAACPGDAEPALRWLARFRDAVKRQSAAWNLSDEPARARLYRLLYASRAALEEALLQQPKRDVAPVARGREVKSATPSVTVQGVEVHSGDLLVSRGGAATSALIARGSDYPGNFSHVALLHIDPDTHAATIIEAHIELGVRVSSLDDYLADKKLRIMVLRLREGLPGVDAMTAHRAATAALERAKKEAIAYDLEMNSTEHTKLFCSELAFAAYEAQGVKLWPGHGHISAPGTRAWLWSLGVRNFATLEPSDLEYDPQLAVVAEWFDGETLTKDHRDNAVTDVMLEGAERGERLELERWRLPLVRLAKAYSAVSLVFGRPGPVPEGMSPEAALRSLAYTRRHEELRTRLDARAAEFEQEHGYAPPYWQLVTLAH
jgi:hypothetical protein